MAIPSQLSTWWNSISAREQVLVKVAGAAVPLVVIVLLAQNTLDGLDELAKQNKESRSALAAVADLRKRGPVAAADSVAEMPTTPESLQTYIGAAASAAGVTISNYGAPAAVTKDGFVTTTVRTEVSGATIAQVKDLLSALETKSKFVAVTSISINRKLREEDKEKLDLRLEVSTYSKQPPTTAEGEAKP